MIKAFLRRFSILLSIVFLHAGAARATTWQVLPNGTGDAPTIQAGIDSAAPGDTVLLGDGTFSGPGNRDLDYGGKAIAVASQSGNADSCAIDCEGSSADPHRGFDFHSGETSSSILQGIKILNGFVSTAGGGALCQSGSPLIVNCIFEGNTSSLRGGALAIGSSTITIVRRCSFMGNYAEEGGAIALVSGGYAEVDSCLFVQNRAAKNGGAAWLSWHYSPQFLNCEFRENVAEGNNGFEGGGAVYSFNSGGPADSFVDCLFVGNSARWGGAIFAEWDFAGGDATPFGLIRCEISRNVASFCGGGVATQAQWSWPPYDYMVRIESCTVFGNEAPGTSGLSLRANNAASYISNTIVANGINGSALDMSDLDPIVCTDLYGNEGGDWVGSIAGDLGINGNFSADPLFCDTAAGILTLDAASPCLNAPGCGQIGAYGQGCDIVTLVSAAGSNVPGTFSLFQNAPNPFNPTTTIRFDLPRQADVVLTILDVAGRRVATLAEGPREAGRFAHDWNGLEETGQEAASGVYFVRLEAGGIARTRKMLLLR